MPSGGASSSWENSSPTRVTQWQKPIFSPRWKMLREELSGAVRILRHTTPTGTRLPAWLPAPYSARHSNTFMVTQNRAIRRKTTRANMQSHSRRREVQRLADLQALGIQTRIGRHQGFHLDAIFPGDGRRRFPGLHFVGAPGVRAGPRRLDVIPRRGCERGWVLRQARPGCRRETEV